MTSIAFERGHARSRVVSEAACQDFSVPQLLAGLHSQRIEIPKYFAAELESLRAESDPELLAEALFALAAKGENRNDLAVAQAGYAYLAERESPIQGRAQQRLAVFQDAGSLGGRTEHFINRFLRDFTQPGLFLGMLAGGATFRSARFLAMSGLSLSGLSPVASRLLGNAAGFALEAPAFVLASRSVGGSADLAHSPIGHELASAYLFLGALKLSGGAVTQAQRRWIGSRNFLLPQAGMLGGILLSHRAEEALGLRPHRDFAALLGESLATLVHLHVSGQVFHRLSGSRYRRWEQRMDLRADSNPNIPQLLGTPALAGPVDFLNNRSPSRFESPPGRGEQTPIVLQMSGDSPISSRPSSDSPSREIKSWDKNTGDYSALAELKARIYPDAPVTPQEIRFDDHFRYSAHLWRRWVIEDGGTIVAQAQFFQPPRMYHPRKFELNVEVHPDYRNQGLGSRLFEEMTAYLENHAPLSLRLNVREDQTAAIRFLEKRDFVGDVREWKSTLDLRAFDRSPYVGLTKKMTEQGVRISTLQDLQSDPHRDRKIFAMESEIIDEVPFPEPQIRLEFDYFVRTVLNNPNLLHDGYFVATAGENYLGTSNLVLRPGQGDQGLLATRFTGVRAAYRRSGLATALKLKTIEYAQDRGFSSLVTSNSSLNSGMVSLNQRLGTKRGLDWISFVKRPH